MATQKCPKCGSSRIRPGYRRTSILSKLVFRYNLLCNNCNLEFKGFAIPGTVGNKQKKIKKKFSDPNYRTKEEIETEKIHEKIEDINSPNSDISTFQEHLLDRGDSDQNILKSELLLEKISVDENDSTSKKTESGRTKVKVRKRVKVRF